MICLSLGWPLFTGLTVTDNLLYMCYFFQVVLLQVLQEWGYVGFDHHVDNVTEFYRKKKEMCIKAAEKHLTGLLILSYICFNPYPAGTESD